MCPHRTITRFSPHLSGTNRCIYTHNDVVEIAAYDYISSHLFDIIFDKQGLYSPVFICVIKL